MNWLMFGMDAGRYIKILTEYMSSGTDVRRESPNILLKVNTLTNIVLVWNAPEATYL